MPNINWTWLIVGLLLGFVAHNFISRRKAVA